MSFYGIGVDMVDINRIQKMHNKYGNKLAQRLLHPEEIRLLESETNPINFIANRFAGKEAAAKADGTGFSRGVNWKDFGVIRQESVCQKKAMLCIY